nr:MULTISPECIES: MASE1 domain-containing protein [Dyella]
MQEGTARFAWARHIAVAALYAACYMLLRAVSVSNWSLPASLRLAALLFVPYRYWPAMIVGEFLPLGFISYICREEFGTTWALLAAIPPILPCAPVVAWFRRRTRLLQSEGRVDMALLLVAMLICAVLTTAGNTAALAVVQSPDNTPLQGVTLQIVFGYFLGNFLGALTLTPVMIAARGWLMGNTRLWLGHAMARGGLLRNAFVYLVPVLVALGLIGYAGSGDTMQICRIAMFLPVAWLALRHGWQGAAVGGALASIAVAFTASVVRDPYVIQAQAIIAFAISTLLMFGSRIARQSDVDLRDHLVKEQGLLLAQQGLYQEEQRLRQAAEALEHVGQSMRDMQNRLLDRLRHTLPANEERAYSRQAALAQHEMHRLTNALYPRAWRERGVPATLQDGPLAQAVSMTGASYKCVLAGRGLSLLAPDVHMTLYRLASEALVYALTRQSIRHVELTVRGGLTHGQRWAVMRMDCVRDALAGDTATATESWKKVMSLLGAAGLGVETIRERAQIYGGGVHVRETSAGLRITILLHDALRTMKPGAQAQQG